jgi:hypothetical protein
VQMIAVDDVGAFAAIALAHPQDYGGKTLEMAGDELTEPQIAATFSEVIGRPVKLASPSPPPDTQRTAEEIAMFQFFSGEGYDADIATLRKIYPGLRTLERWLRENGWEGLSAEQTTTARKCVWPRDVPPGNSTAALSRLQACRDRHLRSSELAPQTQIPGVPAAPSCRRMNLQ